MSTAIAVSVVLVLVAVRGEVANFMTSTADTATAGDIGPTLALTCTTSVNQTTAAQFPPATSTPGALTPLRKMTLGWTMMGSMTHTMTSTVRHRITLLKCEAGKLHLKKGVML